MGHTDSIFSIRRALSVAKQKYIHDEVIFGEKGISQLKPLLITNCPPNPSMIIQRHKLNKNTNHRFSRQKTALSWSDDRLIGIGFGTDSPEESDRTMQHGLKET